MSTHILSPDKIISTTKCPPRSDRCRGTGRLLARGLDMAERTCSIKGCKNEVLARGLCRNHYAIARRNGSIGTRRTCAEPDCDRFVYARAMCGMHYHRQRIAGMFSMPAQVRGLCSQPGCEQPRRAHGLCMAHYMRTLWIPQRLAAAPPCICEVCGTEFQSHRVDREARFCSDICRGFATRGAQHPNWRGGAAVERQRLRYTAAYREWRRAVLERDDYTCQMCGKRGDDFHADHILPFATYPQHRLDVDNGRTLCPPCHRATPTWGGRMQTYR